MSRNPNYLVAYEALKIFRDTTLAFIKTRLEAAYGEGWWAQGVARCFKPETMQELAAQFNRRFDSPLGPTRPGQEQHEVLDINWFTNILEGNWKPVFAAPFHNDRTALTLLREVVELRNPIAHPETGDLHRDDVWRALDSMARLLRVIDPAAELEVQAIKTRLHAAPLSPAPSEVAPDAAAPLPGRSAAVDVPPAPGVAGPPAAARSRKAVAPSAPPIPPHDGAAAPAGGNGNSLLDRIRHEVRQVLDSGAEAWLVWCDPQGTWQPLLEQAAADGGFPLMTVAEITRGDLGGPVQRAAVQARITAGTGFVLLVPVAPDALGWLWALALRAERIARRPLREALLTWGWQPQSLTMSDEAVGVLALKNRHLDPAAWGGGGLQPDRPLLLQVLAADSLPDAADRLILDLTLEAAGLPPFDDAAPAVWRTRALARLLVTQAHSIAPALVGANHDLLIAADTRPFALALLDTWLDSQRLSKALPDRIIAADGLAGLGSLPAAAPVAGAFVSQAAERAVFAAVCNHLATLSGSPLLAAVATQSADLAAHLDGFWGDGCSHPQAVPWRELRRLGQAAARLLAALPPTRWATPAAALTWYTTAGWQVDSAGEALLRDLAQPTPDLLTLIEPLRAAYRAGWERLLLDWSELWATSGCPVPALPTAGEWLKGLLTDARPTAILIVDALRYDVGRTLATAINTSEGVDRATVTPARAPLPSITALGMAYALPLPAAKLEADLVDGKWQIHYQGASANLSVAAERRKWWVAHSHTPETYLLALDTILTGPVPAPGPAATRLVLTDATLDKLGHDDELEALGSGHVRKRYREAVERLREAGWLRILIVTDHGYIHWTNPDDTSVAAPTPNPVYKSRRALAYPPTTALTAPHSLAPGGRWSIVPAPGAASFQAYGGLGYFHGGASLQEWIIPCIQIVWPAKAQPVGVDLLPIATILGERPRLTVLVIRSALLGETDLPRSVYIVIRDPAGTILFRSDSVSLTPDLHQRELAVPAVEGTVAARGTVLRIEVHDSQTDQILAGGSSVLMTELTGW